MSKRKPRTWEVTDAQLQLARECRAEGCGARLVFLQLDTGGTMVLDVSTRQPGLAPGTWFLEPHWGRCTDADRFRRTRPLQ